MSYVIDSNRQKLLFTDKNFFNVIKNKLITDEDFNGNNGTDYLSEEAEKSGFDNDFDYILNFAKDKTKKLSGEKKIRKALGLIIEHMENHGGDYYQEIDYDLTKCGDKFILYFFTTTKW